MTVGGHFCLLVQLVQLIKSRPMQLTIFIIVAGRHYFYPDMTFCKAYKHV